MAPALLDERARRKLEGLTLAAPHVRAGAMKGERRSNKRGASIEFADTRDYTPGDDLRRLDWNALARLDRPLVRLYEDEEDLAVHILIDCSASMEGDSGDEAALASDVPAAKFTYARQLAAALAYISLLSNDRLMVVALRGASTGERLGPLRGRAATPRLFAFMGGLQTGGTTDLNATLRSYTLNMRPGLVLLVTDGFSPGGLTDGLSALVGRGCEIALLHTLAPEEIEPSLTGDLSLIDRETGIAQEISLDAHMRTLYRQRVEEWRASLREECGRRGVHYLPVDMAAPWEEFLLKDMRRVGVVR